MVVVQVGSFIHSQLVFSNYFNSGAVVVYTLRVNMSVAAPKMLDALGWTESEKGFVLVS